MYVYSFDGTSISSSIVTLNLDENIKSVSWRPDGKYLALGTTGDKLYVYRVNYLYDTSPQTFDTGIIFGDSSQTNGDLDIKVLAGTHVKIHGFVTHDT